MSKKIFSHFKRVDPKLHSVLEKVYAIHGDEIFTLRKQSDVQNSERIQHMHLKKHDFLFDKLVESIISQQLLVRVADVIYERVLNLITDKLLTPENLLEQKETDLRKAGLSYQKIRYLKDLSQKVKDKELDLDNLDNLENEEVIKELIEVKGIGKWTAEMFLMAALGRPDIFSHGDLGLQNAIKKIYQLEKYDPIVVEEIVIKWSPYRTVAARILWRSLSLKD